MADRAKLRHVKVFAAAWLVFVNFHDFGDHIATALNRRLRERVRFVDADHVSAEQTLAEADLTVLAAEGLWPTPGVLVQALSAFWFGPIYRDVAVYVLFVLMLWVRPQGLLGTA